MSSTRTTATLLEGLHDARNRSAWRRFVRCYRPLVVHLGRRLGLNRDDAEDAAQQTILAFIEAYRGGKYDRGQGRLKNWLLGIAKNKIADLHAERGRRRLAAVNPGTSGVILEAIRDPHSWSDVWDREWQAAILRACFDRARGHFRPRDFRVFEMVWLEEVSVEEAAQTMGITANNVCVIKHRVLSRIRAIEAELECR